MLYCPNFFWNVLRVWMTGKDVYLQMTWSWPDKTWNILCSYCLQWNTSQSKFRNHYFLFLFAFSILSQLFLIWGCIYIYIGIKKMFCLLTVFSDLWSDKEKWKISSLERKKKKNNFNMLKHANNSTKYMALFNDQISVLKMYANAWFINYTASFAHFNITFNYIFNAKQFD